MVLPFHSGWIVLTHLALEASPISFQWIIVQRLGLLRAMIRLHFIAGRSSSGFWCFSLQHHVDQVVCNVWFPTHCPFLAKVMFVRKNPGSYHQQLPVNTGFHAMCTNRPWLGVVVFTMYTPIQLCHKRLRRLLLLLRRNTQFCACTILSILLAASGISHPGSEW